MVVELVVDRIVAGGNGLARLDGKTVFVPFTAPQERVRARLVVQKKDYAVGEVEEILEPSGLRTDPPCPHFTTCGGCQLQHISYEGQIVVKKLIANDALQHIGKVFVPVSGTTARSEPFHYRNKTQYPVGPGPRVGFYKHGTHDLVDVPECLLHHPDFDRVRQGALDAIASSGETVYDEQEHTGNMRHLVIRRAEPSGGLLIIVATRASELAPGLRDALAGIEGVVGVVQSVNPDRTNRILGDTMLTLAGQDRLEIQVLDKRFSVSPASFFQVNTPQAAALCTKVLKHARPEGNETVLDLYSGVGMLSLVLAGFTNRVIGVELAADAVQDAEVNAQVNGTTNVEFTEGDVDRVIESQDKADVVILDPPRKGCAAETLKRVAGLKPRRIVYVSCNPATLARDLRLLDGLGYRTREVEPVDMFPQTAHVETVTRLETDA